MTVACPACGRTDHELIYTVDRVPTHSCVLLPSHAAAVSVSVSPLELVACTRCGLVFNRAFDVDRIDYEQDYEETQAFSPRFVAFLDELVELVGERVELRDRYVLEVGCGKGEFLARMCAVTGASGLGIDPAWNDARRPADAPADVRFHRGYLAADSVESGDLVACRHTLEHVADVGTFTRWLRDAAARTPGSWLLLEVPAAERILEEGAFWDVYHEHVNYFTADALRSLAVSCGIGVDVLESAYADQYVVLLGQVEQQGVGTSATGGWDDPATAQDVRDRFTRTIDAWSRWFDDQHQAGRRVALWGAGSKAVATLVTLDLTDEVVVATDVNPHKWGHHLPMTGHAVVAPERLGEYDVNTVVAMNPIYLDEIRRDLDEMGMTEVELVALTPVPPNVGR